MKKNFYLVILLLIFIIFNSNNILAQPSYIQPCVASGNGTDYPIGPGQTYTSIHDIPWGNLQPGDTVRIHYRSTPYREKILIRSKGTETNPIRICGVPGPNGERPIIDGDGAVNDPDDAGTTGYGGYAPMQGLGLIMIYERDYYDKAKNIIIDGLHIRNARDQFQFTDVSGNQQTYPSGAACIRVQSGDNITIRNNEIENCSNGIFTMSQGRDDPGNPSQSNDNGLTRNLLIEGNYIHNNGQPGSYREHGIYAQAVGVTYQYNRFGPNFAGSEGTTLKERAAGSVIRYNWFDSGSARSLDLVEVEDAKTWYIAEQYLNFLGCTDANNCPNLNQTRWNQVQNYENMYRETFVYGNFFNHIGSQTQAGSLVHYGWDNDINIAREGKLYFYNNNISIQQDQSDSWRFRLFDMRNDYGGTPTSKETIEVFNNIIYNRSETNGATISFFCMSQSGGTINFGKNWISNYDQQANISGCYGGSRVPPTLNGLSNLIDGTNAPAPMDVNLQTINTPLVLNQAQSLPSAVSSYQPTLEYLRHNNLQNRINLNDLGAMAVSSGGGDTIAPIIILTGANPQTITQGQAYTELGATASDNVDGNLTSSIVIDSSAVNTAVVGTYSVTYNVSDSAGNAATQVSRTVNVVSAPDTTAPIITLTGANPQTITQGQAYTELGATASDNVDGNLTSSIVIDSSAVNTAVVGTYSVTYNVSDSAGNAATQVSRTVNVIASQNNGNSGGSSGGNSGSGGSNNNSGGGSNSSSGSSSRKKSSKKYVCRDSKALNYQERGIHKWSICKYNLDKIKEEKEDIKEEKEGIKISPELEKLKKSLLGDVSRTDKEVVVVLQEIITKLTKQVQELKNKNNSFAQNISKKCFVNKHRWGSRGEEVVRIQEFLRQQGLFAFPRNTGFYGRITFEAVKKFQQKYEDVILKPLGLKYPTGNWYSLTIKKANQLSDCQ